MSAQRTVSAGTPAAAHLPTQPDEELHDEALVSRVARSETAALAELYDRYGRVAYGLARRILRDPALAEDAVQDAFLAVWRSAASYQENRATPRSWILTLVHRRAVDVVRREEGQRRRRDLIGPDSPCPESAEEAAWLKAERSRTRAALESLPASERRLLELAYYGGLTQSELAAHLGIPLGTVKSRTHTALGRLRELLSDEAAGQVTGGSAGI